MKKLFESQYNTISYDLSKSLMQWTFLEGSKLMRDEAYQDALLKYAEFVEQYLPNKLFIHCENQFYTVSPEMQAWVAENIAPRTPSIKRIAYVVAKDLFANISSQQLMEEEKIAKNYPTQYFEKEEDALRWLMN